KGSQWAMLCTSLRSMKLFSPRYRPNNSMASAYKIQNVRVFSGMAVNPTLIDVLGNPCRGQRTRLAGGRSFGFRLNSQTEQGAQPPYAPDQLEPQETHRGGDQNQERPFHARIQISGLQRMSADDDHRLMEDINRKYSRCQVATGGAVVNEVAACEAQDRH